MNSFSGGNGTRVGPSLKQRARGAMEMLSAVRDYDLHVWRNRFRLVGRRNGLILRGVVKEVKAAHRHNRCGECYCPSEELTACRRFVCFELALQPLRKSGGYFRHPFIAVQGNDVPQAAHD